MAPNPSEERDTLILEVPEVAAAVQGLDVGTRGRSIRVARPGWTWIVAAIARRADTPLLVVVPEDAPRRPRRPIPTRRRGQAADPGRAAEGPAAARTPED